MAVRRGGKGAICALLSASFLLLFFHSATPRRNLKSKDLGDSITQTDEGKDANSGSVWLKSLDGKFKFPFKSHTGSWYSAVSTPSMQWNFKVHKFDGCKSHEGDTFVTGFGLTLFDSSGQAHHVEATVVNEFLVDSGCGKTFEKRYEGCLGAGSLELVVDGHKITEPTDGMFGDVRVFASNTISKCARGWFPYEVGKSDMKSFSPDEKPHDVIENIVPNSMMFDLKGCGSWLEERRENEDLTKLAGTHSTILVQTENISFHIEYNQEQERCDAHHLNVWISKISQELLDESPWKGVLGETKYLKKLKGRARQNSVLMHSNYEVISPKSLDCVDGCLDRHLHKPDKVDELNIQST